jgi:hypothetical protein
MKLIGLSIGGVVLFALFVVGVDQAGFALGLWDTTFWGVKQANAERQVFINTNSYIQGKTEYLTRLRLQYETVDDGHKAALREMILSEASNVDNSKLPPDLAAFIQNLKEN